ncbi:unnamed protein product [Danaus chrysippus]|uniref:(African queen) hypothetical protein n=1 Tax=Danaus chrysippus TaxID=151541 RepID=A0A8J2QK49_9NEOP|nr:unnamed protein product [Danaus chrysippus]
MKYYALHLYIVPAAPREQNFEQLRNVDGLRGARARPAWTGLDGVTGGRRARITSCGQRYVNKQRRKHYIQLEQDGRKRGGGPRQHNERINYRTDYIVLAHTWMDDELLFLSLDVLNIRTE